MQLVQYWSHVSWVTITEAYVKTFCHSPQKKWGKSVEETKQEVSDDLGVSVSKLQVE